NVTARKSIKLKIIASVFNEKEVKFCQLRSNSIEIVSLLMKTTILNYLLQNYAAIYEVNIFEILNTLIFSLQSYSQKTMSVQNFCVALYMGQDRFHRLTPYTNPDRYIGQRIGRPIVGKYANNEQGKRH